MKKIKDEIIRFEFSSDFQKEEETEKKEKIGAICERIVLLGEFKFIKEISNFEKEASNKFSTQIKNWIHQLRKAVETRTFDEQSCYLLNLQYSNLQLIFNFYSGDKDLYSEFCKIPEILREQVKTIYDQTFKTKDFQEKVKGLIQLQTIFNHLIELKTETSGFIENILKSLKDSEGYDGLNTLGIELNQDPTGHTLVSSHRFFKNLSLSWRNEKLQKMTFQEVVDKMVNDKDQQSKTNFNDNLDVEILKKKYEQFNTDFDNLVKNNLKPNKIDYQNVKSQLDLTIRKLNPDSFYGQLKEWFSSSLKTEMPFILACLFAYYTLLNAEDYFSITEKVEENQKKKFLFQPHAGQVISILRMINCGDKDMKIQNNLVEIGTGEGKSVTLAMVSTLFALLGYEVHVACYSPYLSARDQATFLKFFIDLNVDRYIHYGTFNSLCEKNINSDFDIRDKVLSMIEEDRDHTLLWKSVIKFC